MQILQLAFPPVQFLDVIKMCIRDSLSTEYEIVLGRKNVAVKLIITFD